MEQLGYLRRDEHWLQITHYFQMKKIVVGFDYREPVNDFTRKLHHFGKHGLVLYLSPFNNQNISISCQEIHCKYHPQNNGHFVPSLIDELVCWTRDRILSNHPFPNLANYSTFIYHIALMKFLRNEIRVLFQRSLHFCARTSCELR